MVVDKDIRNSFDGDMKIHQMKLLHQLNNDIIQFNNTNGNTNMDLKLKSNKASMYCC